MAYMYMYMYMYMKMYMNKSRPQLPRPRTALRPDVKQSPTAQDAFQPIPGLISCACTHTIVHVHVCIQKCVGYVLTCTSWVQGTDSVTILLPPIANKHMAVDVPVLEAAVTFVTLKELAMLYMYIHVYMYVQVCTCRYQVLGFLHAAMF